LIIIWMSFVREMHFLNNNCIQSMSMKLAVIYSSLIIE